MQAAKLITKAQAAGVEIADVNLSYGNNLVLKDVNLSIKPGEFFAFLGPSGCGKTTLLRLIAGFNKADRGHVTVGGKDITDLPPWQRDVGMVFQSYALWPHMSVARNVAFGLEERRVPRSEITQRVAAALEVVGLSAYAARMPSQLSGGQQQRVALARTIVIEPKILLLDEPLSNLDAKMRVDVRMELRDLQQRLGVTTIFVTHDQEEANAICDRMAVMKDGVIQQVGTPRELYEHPCNLFVANFLGSANLLSGHVETLSGKNIFRLKSGDVVPIPDHTVVQPGAKLMIRPQSLTVAPDTTKDAWSGIVHNVEFLGATLRYRITLGSEVFLVDTPFRPGDIVFSSGDPVALTVDTKSILWLAE